MHKSFIQLLIEACFSDTIINHNKNVFHFLLSAVFGFI